MWEYEFALQRSAERLAAADHDRLVRSFPRSGRRERRRVRMAPVVAAPPVSQVPEVGCRRAAAFSAGRA
jgi:hypothetical protein